MNNKVTVKSDWSFL